MEYIELNNRKNIRFAKQTKYNVNILYVECQGILGEILIFSLIIKVICGIIVLNNNIIYIDILVIYIKLIYISFEVAVMQNMVYCYYSK